MQYPHTITLTTVGASTTDANGDYSTPAATEVELKGRYEASGGKNLIPGDQGQQVEYTGIVYLPFPETPIALGSEIEVHNSDGWLLAKGTVLQFMRGEVLRENARIWL